MDQKVKTKVNKKWGCLYVLKHFPWPQRLTYDAEVIQFELKRLDSKVSVDMKNEYVTVTFILLRMVKTSFLVDAIIKI